jgi:TLD
MTTLRTPPPLGMPKIPLDTALTRRVATDSVADGDDVDPANLVDDGCCGAEESEHSIDTSSKRSTTSRLSLKELVLKHAAALTSAEKNFLDELFVNGNEIEVQLAHETLTDLLQDSVVLDDATAYNADISCAMMDDSQSSMGWQSATIHVGRERDSLSLRSSLPMTTANDFMDNSNNDPSSSDWFTSSGVFVNTMSGRSGGAMGSFSSERRLLLLQERKDSVCNLYKAHETGLAVSQQASRRSVLVRRNSIVLGKPPPPPPQQRDNALWAATATPGTATAETIFRPLCERTRPNIRRRVSWTPGPTLSGMGSSNHGQQAKLLWTLQHTSRQSLVDATAVGPIRQSVPRMSSESSRGKSVTFSEEVSSAGPPPKLPLGLPFRASTQRSASLPAQLQTHSEQHASSVGSSIPSLHLGTRVGSPESTLASIPSLHMAHAVRSYSTRSDSCSSDITESERFLESDREEKKSSWEAAPSSIVVLPKHGSDPMLLEATKLLHKNDPNAPLRLPDNDQDDQRSSTTATGTSAIRPVLMRRASRNVDQGEGIEVSNLSTDEIEDYGQVPSLFDFLTMKTSSSFDETMSSRRLGNSIFRRIIRRSLSGDSNGIFLGAPLDSRSSRNIGLDMEDESSSWNDDDDYYDSWKVLDDEYVNGYGGGDTLPFAILGTSSDDAAAHPHVLSPPLMESLLAFLPPAKHGDNFWMKYSMVRDGASFYTFLQHARGAKYSILAIETVEGEVFGAFTAEPWRKNWNYYGSGESFLWKMRHSRKTKCHSIIDQAQMESEIDVYPYTGVNSCIQLCTSDKIAVGGGTHELSASSLKSRKSEGSSFDTVSHDEKRDEFKDHEWGFGLTIESDFLHGTTSPCLTFGSPPLSSEHPSGSLFEIMNLELWTLTPCSTLEDADKLELSKLFLEKHTKQ